MKTSVIAQILLAGTAVAMPQIEKRQTSSVPPSSTISLGKRADEATSIMASAGGDATASAAPLAVVAGGSAKGISGSSVKTGTKAKRMMNNANMMDSAHMMDNAEMMNTADTMNNADMMSNADMMETADTMNNADMMNTANNMNNADMMNNVDNMNNVDMMETADMMAIPNKVVKRQTITASAQSLATATAAPNKVSSNAAGNANAKSITRMKAIPDQEGVMRTASGALMNALRNDVDLQTFGQMVDTVKNHAGELEAVLKNYNQQAEAAKTPEAAAEAIDQNQMMADIVTPLSSINDALFDGISRMAMSSELRPSRGGYGGVGNVAGSFDLVSQLLSVIVLLLGNLFSGAGGATGLLGGVTGGSGGSGNLVGGLLNGLLGGLLGGGGGLLGGLLGGGLLGGGSTATTDPITGTVNSILGLVNGLVPIGGVTDALTPALNIGL